MFCTILLLLIFGGIFLVLTLALLIPVHQCLVYTIPLRVHTIITTRKTLKLLDTRFHRHFTVKQWELKECELMWVTDYPDIYEKMLKCKSKQVRICVSKFLLLLKYGGIYVDSGCGVDNLKSLKKLLQTEFLIVFHSGNDLTFDVIASSIQSVMIKTFLDRLSSSFTMEDMYNQFVEIAKAYNSEVVDISSISE